ncbi:MAG: sensor histidine kinase [Acidobacteriota bacterium]
MSDVLGLILFTFGALVCTGFSLLIDWRRYFTAARPRLERLQVFMLLFAAVWFYVNATQSFLLVFYPQKGYLVRTIGLLTLWMTPIFPPVILEMACAEHKVSLQRGIRLLRAVVWGLSCGMLLTDLVLTIRIFQMPAALRGFPYWLFGYGFSLDFLLCGLGCGWLMARDRGPYCELEEPSDQLAYRRWHIALFTFFVLICVPFFFATSRKEGTLIQYASVLARALPLPFILVSFYYEARAAFLDVLIKKIAVVVLGVSIGTVAVHWVFRQGVSPVTQIALLAPLFVVLLFLRQPLEVWIDRHLFGRRYSRAEALADFSSALNATQESDLVSKAEESLQRIFSARHATVRLDSNSADTGRDENAVSRGLVAPVVAAGERLGTVELGPRPSREPYLSEDSGLLKILLDQMALALVNLRLLRKQAEQQRRQQELEMLASRSELKALRSQVNPHFLFNALNTIAALVPADPDRAERMVERLADVFRFTLHRSESETISLADELQFVRAYLQIERVRFGDKLKFVEDVAPEVGSTRVPGMILQPVVENAIKHGIAPRREGGTITLEARRNGKGVEIVVRDDGSGFDPALADRLWKEGFGLRGVRDRVKTQFGEQGEVLIASRSGGGTEVKIVVPFSV